MTVLTHALVGRIGCYALYKDVLYILPRIQSSRKTIIGENIWRYFPEDVVGSEKPQDMAWST